jgi:hypothetical protein
MVAKGLVALLQCDAALDRERAANQGAAGAERGEGAGRNGARPSDAHVPCLAVALVPWRGGAQVQTKILGCETAMIGFSTPD